MASQAGQTQAEGSVVGTLGFPQGWECGCNSCRCVCTLAGCEFWTLTCVAQAASLFGGTGGSDEG